ncbi:hypothetical protein HGM15179_002496 [Zosterops borbonicus]|uniref:Uncharacterized protein n=1 Tax=Zosterops borbonicus TaxID=364589 RepID=A0A8K1GVS5_9PASS|nr:hypothetical protein HGM15179_002496 [Zosterops borbonicus]
MKKMLILPVATAAEKWKRKTFARAGGDNKAGMISISMSLKLIMWTLQSWLSSLIQLLSSNLTISIASLGSEGAPEYMPGYSWKIERQALKDYHNEIYFKKIYVNVITYKYIKFVPIAPCPVTTVPDEESLSSFPVGPF